MKRSERLIVGLAIGAGLIASGFSAEQHKFGPWQPIQAAREKGVYPPK